MRCKRALSPLAVAVASLTTASVAAAEAVAFEYTAPPGCPTLEHLVAEVHARSIRYGADTANETARRFFVSITTHDQGATGRVDFVDANGTSVSRTIDGATCDEVVSGIALVSALAIDDAWTAAAQRRAESAPAESPAPSAAAEAELAPAPARPLVSAPASPLTYEELSSKAPAPDPLSKSAGVEKTARFEAGIGAGFSSYAGPSGAPTVDGFLQVGASEAGPTARVSVWHFRSDTARGGREARFRGYGLRLDACPVALGAGRLFAEPCLGVDGGLLHAEGIPGTGVVDPRSMTRLWWTAALIGRAGVVVSDWLVLEAQAELGVVLLAHRFGFGDPPGEARVFDVPRVGGNVRGGVGVRF